MTASRPDARAIAVGAIRAWLETEAFPERLIPADAPDHAFVVELVQGVARWKRRLEWIARKLAEHPPDAGSLPYLLIGLYQLYLLEHVAPYAAVDETVEAAKQELGRKAAGFVNAVLREAIRRREALDAELAEEPIGIQVSHPDDLLRRWIRRIGMRPTLARCEWDNSRPEVVLHPNTLRTSVAEFRRLAADRGVALLPHPAAPDAWFQLPRGVRVEEVPGYAEGLFTVQDPSTGMAVALLDPQPGERVLDACAAPGGKTALIAERMTGRGELVAMDLHEDRLGILRGNLARLRLDSAVRVVQGNASLDGIARAADGRLFDRILLDVPCSNTGVLRRRPDARWRFSMRRLARHADIQRLMLAVALDHLKPTGTLVYSTCSLEPEENEGLVEGWLARHPEWELIASREAVPPDSRTDGAYAAAIRQRR
jgi:16S rRNA (cytosine967-C5)-methyltransferase